jgi:hypothetical protein
VREPAESGLHGRLLLTAAVVVCGLVHQVLIENQVGWLVDQRVRSLGRVSRHAAEELGAPRKRRQAVDTWLRARAGSGFALGSWLATVRDGIAP